MTISIKDVEAYMLPHGGSKAIVFIQFEIANLQHDRFVSNLDAQKEFTSSIEEAIKKWEIDVS